MKKQILTSIMTLGLLTAIASRATEQSQILNGHGVDGKKCSVKIIRDDNTLKSVVLTGATKDFEIIGETENGYGPNSRINEAGGKILPNDIDGKNIFPYFKQTKNLFTNGEEFALDMSDLPKSEEMPPGISLKIKMSLSYTGSDYLTSFKAQSKVKALGVATLTSVLFVCEK